MNSVLPTLGLVYPLPAHQVAAMMAAAGITSLGQPYAPTAPLGSAVSVETLTRVQGEIVAALTKKPPLNERQVAILEIYWQASRDGEPALPIKTIAQRLVLKVSVDPARAPNYVEGALRSFGKRLRAELSKFPVQFGKDLMGDGVADEIPLLAMIMIEKGLTGEARHRLTLDGFVAVRAALAMNGEGEAAASPGTGTGGPDEVVTLAMSRLAAALVARVARSKGIGIDEAVKFMAALAGAG